MYIVLSVDTRTSPVTVLDVRNAGEMGWMTDSSIEETRIVKDIMLYS